MPSETPNPKINPAALPLGDLARLLTAAGGKVISVEMLQADLAAGAPANPDGTVNLVQYSAWLLREVENDGH